MTGKRRSSLSEVLMAGAAFVYYWIMALYKLTEAPIWQDEAMEFYCSIPVKGAIRGVTEYSSMYERMANIQQQPPLYNWFICLWLQISEGEWWYRFSSVVMGFIAVVGLYLVVKKLCSKYMAAFSVVIFSSIYIVMYYMKEASEYSMLIMFVIWLIYLYLHMLERVSAGRIAGFVILCVVTIYTHYSAVFLVVPMAIQLLYIYYRDRDWKSLKLSLGGYGMAGLLAGLPLAYFFLKPQSANAVSTLKTNNPLDITGNNIILDFFDSLMWVLRWCMLDYDRDAELFTPIMWVLLAGILILAVVCFRITKRREIRCLICCNAGIYFIYYVITTLNIYAYGWFGNRYNLFILPVWFITIIVIVYEMIQVAGRCDKEWVRKGALAVKLIAIAGAVLFCMYGVKRINDHWGKGDQRNLVSTWYEEECYKVPTFVNFHQRYAFMYYYTHNEAYKEECWEHLISNQNLESLSFNNEEWISYLETEVYQEGLPEQLYVVSGQHDTIVNALESIGYTVDPIVDTTTKMFLLTAPEN